MLSLMCGSEDYYIIIGLWSQQLKSVSVSWQIAGYMVWYRHLLAYYHRRSSIAKTSECQNMANGLFSLQ